MFKKFHIKKLYKLLIAFSLCSSLPFLSRADDTSSFDAGLALYTTGSVIGNPSLQKEGTEKLQKGAAKTLAQSILKARQRFVRWLAGATSSEEIDEPVKVSPEVERAAEAIAEAAIKKGPDAVAGLRDRINEIFEVTVSESESIQKEPVENVVKERAVDAYKKVDQDMVKGIAPNQYIFVNGLKIGLFRAPATAAGFEKGEYYVLKSDLPVKSISEVAPQRETTGFKKEQKPVRVKPAVPVAPKKMKPVEISATAVKKLPQGTVRNGKKSTLLNPIWVTKLGEKPVFKAAADEKEVGIKKGKFYIAVESE